MIILQHHIFKMLADDYPATLDKITKKTRQKRQYKFFHIHMRHRFLCRENPDTQMRMRGMLSYFLVPLLDH